MKKPDQIQDSIITSRAVPIPQSPLDMAKQIVYGGRQDEYGPPEDSFTNIGIVWGCMLQGLRGWHVGEAIPPKTVALMMVMLKVIRDGHHQKHDNLIDIAGYAECAFLVSKGFNIKGEIKS